MGFPFLSVLLWALGVQNVHASTAKELRKEARGLSRRCEKTADLDACVELGSRYAKGEGVEQSVSDQS